MAEMTQVSDQAPDAVAERRDRTPEFLALGWFVAVTLLGAGLIAIQLQVPDAITKVGPWVVAIVFVLFLRWGKPSSSLTPARRAQRNERRAAAVVGALSGCCLIGAITAATYLTTWWQWLVLGSFVMTGIGVVLMLHTRFTIGP